MKDNCIDVRHSCECEEVHTHIVNIASGTLPDEETAYGISDLFKVFGDPTRLKILFALEASPMCGCDLAEALGITKAAVSYQLKMLRSHDLVRCRKEGKNVIYRLSDEHVRAIIDCAIEHIKE